MLLYEHNDQRGVIYDGEREDLVPDWAKVIGRYSELTQRREEIERVTIEELQKILWMY